MKTELKPGRWEDRNGDVWTVRFNYVANLWMTEGDPRRTWCSDGSFWAHDEESQYDLVRYLGPIELSPSTACAEAGPAGDLSTVSTEDPQESLRRMRRLEATVHRELEIYVPLVARLKTTASDLDEAIKALERKVKG